jgi:hypothetical protein
MALLASELQRIKYELGFPVLETGAEPYIGIAAVFDGVIKPYLSAGANTTSATVVSAATSPTLTTLNLATATGVSANCRLVVDVDDAQELCMLQSISGTSACVYLSNAHTGTYPVTVEGGESIVRNLLRKLRAIDKAQEEAIDGAGVKKVDEIEFFGGNSSRSGSTQFADLSTQREHWRNELRRVLFGAGGTSSGYGSTCSVY